ncbi:uncharacterized protein V1513DRAFT_440107 [Lipomyces chichibuensis]|uniref:uncharacterized protein n=1 Tax=Lipomyces chichibuensis TaxID=1546026 RepID=UPI0033441659
MGMYVRTSRAQGAAQKLRMCSRLQNQSSWSMHGSESGRSPTSRDANSVVGRDSSGTQVNLVDFMQSFVSSKTTIVDQNENFDVRREARARELEKLLSLEKFQQAKSEENSALIQETRRKKLSEQLQMAARKGQQKDQTREQDNGTLQSQVVTKPSPLAELFHGLEKAALAREKQRQRAAELKTQRDQGKTQFHVQRSLDPVDIKKIVESIPVSKGSKWKQEKKTTVVSLRQEDAREKSKTTVEAKPMNQQRKSGGQQRIISNVPNTELPKSGYVDLVDEQRVFHSRLSLQEVQKRLPLGYKLIRVQLEDSRGKGSLMVVRIIKKKNSEMSVTERDQWMATVNA